MIPHRVRIFMSYSQKDILFVSRLRADLERDGYDVWNERTQTQPLDDFVVKIGEAIDATLKRGAILPILSENSVQSEWVRREVAYALARKADHPQSLIIPCHIHPTPSPQEIPPGLNFIQYIDFRTDYAAAYGTLIVALKTL